MVALGEGCGGIIVAVRARLTSPSYFSRLKRGCRSLDVGMRWKFCILLALILVVIAATAYQAWQGYESWIVFGVILAYLALAIAV